MENFRPNREDDKRDRKFEVRILTSRIRFPSDWLGYLILSSSLAVRPVPSNLASNYVVTTAYPYGGAPKHWPSLAFAVKSPKLYALAS